MARGPVFTIAKKNTAFYMEDFKEDRKLIRKMPVGSTFIWLSRPCGTNLYMEDQAFLKDSAAYTSILHYSEQVEELIHAYVVEIKNKDESKIFGDLYTICPDYSLSEYAEHIRQSASEVGSYTLVYKKGSITIPEIQRGYLENDPNLGRLVGIVPNPKDKELHEMTLAQERNARKKADLGDFEKHLIALNEQVYMHEANRIIDEISKLSAPNSEDGEYYQVDISAACLQIILRRRRMLFNDLQRYLPFRVRTTLMSENEGRAFVSVPKEAILKRQQ